MSAELHMDFPVATASRRSISSRAFAQNALTHATRIWFVVTMLGQLFFAFVVASFYGLTAARGDFWAWNKNITHGWVSHDRMGNGMVAMHLASAVVIILAGAIQFVPPIRNRFPAFHRLTGRFYVLSAMTLTGGGLYMHWVRGSVGDAAARWGSTGNAVAIWLCAIFAVRYAIARQFAAHRRWTIRLFLAVSASWFYRAGLFLSFLIFQGPVGFDPSTFTGPFITFMSYGTYLVPLAIAEIYFFVQQRPGAIGRFAMATTLAVLTVATAAGTVAVTAASWVPTLKAAYDTRISIGGKLSAAIETRGIDAAIAEYRRLKAASPANYNFGEGQLNAVGYQLLRAKRLDEAIRIFVLNVEAYPKSANTYDSLGEAYLNAGRKSLAIANYRRSLQLNPKNRGAEAVLRKLNAL